MDIFFVKLWTMHTYTQIRITKKEKYKKRVQNNIRYLIMPSHRCNMKIMPDFGSHRQETQNMNHNCHSHPATQKRNNKLLQDYKKGHKLLAAGLQCFWKQRTTVTWSHGLHSWLSCIAAYSSQFHIKILFLFQSDIHNNG